MSARVRARADHGDSERHRPWAGRGRALALAIVLTFMLVLLASAVFSIAARSREVASRSVALHSLNESLRAATVVRAQVTFAAYLAANDSTYGTDSRADIRVAAQEARRNLKELEATSSQAQRAGTLDAGTNAALARFTAAANRTLVVTAGRRPSSARLLVRDRLVPSFAVLRDRLVVQRDVALADVKHAGSLLGRLGGLASFVIAFVLPTVTVLVYRQITRRSRESIEIARLLALERGRSQRRQLLLAGALIGLQAELERTEAAEGDARAAALRRLCWDVDALTTVITGTGPLGFGDLDLGAELEALASSLRDMGIDVGVTAADGAAWADPATLGAAVRSLVLEAESSGAQRIELESFPREKDVELRIAHDGAALAPAVAALVFERTHDDERSAAEAGAAPLHLLAALDRIEAMGGSLGHDDGPGRPAYVVRLPGGGMLRAPSSVELPAATVAPA